MEEGVWDEKCKGWLVCWGKQWRGVMGQAGGRVLLGVHLMVAVVCAQGGAES